MPHPKAWNIKDMMPKSEAWQTVTVNRMTWTSDRLRARENQKTATRIRMTHGHTKAKCRANIVI